MCIGFCTSIPQSTVHTPNSNPMTLQKLLRNLKTVKRCHLPNPSSPIPTEKIADLIIPTTLTSSSCRPLFCDLTPSNVHLILADPHLKTSKCIDFFNFLLKNQSLISFKLDLQAHFTLLCRLIKARKFTDTENLLNSLSVDENRRYPFSAIASFIENHCNEPKVLAKLFNLMLKVYSDSQKFEDALETFNYMRNNGIEINERTCTVHLIALVRDDRVGSALEFFNRMAESGIEVSVFSLTVVVDGLCKCGEIKRARELVEEMVGRGVKPNIITYNTLVDACAKKWNFGELDLILVLMEREGVEFSVETYKFLIDGFSSSGKIEEAERMVKEMHDKGFKVDAHLYTLIINGYCRVGNMESAFSLFGQMTKGGVSPNADTYYSLVSGLCKVGRMETVKELVDEMQQKRIELDQVVFNTTISGYCNEGLIDEALGLHVVMQKKGFVLDVFAYDMIANGLCKLGRMDEAKLLLSIMVKRGVTIGMWSCTPLLGAMGHCGSEEAVSGDGKKGVSPNTALYSDLMDGFCDEANVKEAQNLTYCITDLEFMDA